MIGVGRVGNVGSVSRRATVPSGAPDFTLSGASVVTAWGTVEVGTLTPVAAPTGAYFVLAEGTAASGDEAGLAVVNG